MSVLTDLKNTYLETSGHLQAMEMAARSPASRDRWAKRRDVNDKAYFMLMFANFEDHVTQNCERLISERKASVGARKNKRAWSVLAVNRMKFMNKVGLLVDKGGVNYNSVDQKYAIRCDIAHGSFSTVGPVNILNEYLEFKRLLSALKPS